MAGFLGGVGTGFFGKLGQIQDENRKLENEMLMEDQREFNKSLDVYRKTKKEQEEINNKSRAFALQISGDPRDEKAFQIARSYVVAGHNVTDPITIAQAQTQYKGRKITNGPPGPISDAPKSPVAPPGLGQTPPPASNTGNVELPEDKAELDRIANDPNYPADPAMRDAAKQKIGVVNTNNIELPDDPSELLNIVNGNTHDPAIKEAAKAKLNSLDESGSEEVIEPGMTPKVPPVSVQPPGFAQKASNIILGKKSPEQLRDKSLNQIAGRTGMTPEQVDAIRTGKDTGVEKFEGTQTDPVNPANAAIMAMAMKAGAEGKISNSTKFWAAASQGDWATAGNYIIDEKTKHEFKMAEQKLQNAGALAVAQEKGEQAAKIETTKQEGRTALQTQKDEAKTETQRREHAHKTEMQDRDLAHKKEIAADRIGNTKYSGEVAAANAFEKKALEMGIAPGTPVEQIEQQVIPQLSPKDQLNYQAFKTRVVMGLPQIIGMMLNPMGNPNLPGTPAPPNPTGKPQLVK